VTGTVLHPATKPCELFRESLRFAAYGHVRALMSEAAASLQAETDGGDANESASPPAKRAKIDSRSASLKLLATAAVTLVSMIG